eukprot:GHVP01024168.1.p1 GENE.GHVP01024168.1~~GHVP01024168.1.p1  ORF type:complete len:401 (-),score=58.00 GHVP01024168.1:906-2108(-)
MWYFLLFLIATILCCRILLQFASKVSKEEKFNALSVAKETAETSVVKLFLLLLNILFWCSPVSLPPPSETPSFNKVDQFSSQRKTIIFTRHGESSWNSVFNRQLTIYLPVRILFLILWSVVKLLDEDSVLYDSPLSDVGLSQSLALAKQLDEKINKESTISFWEKSLTDKNQKNASLRTAGSSPKVIYVSSQLRRAISTALISLSSVFRDQPSAAITALPFLQEYTRNSDSIALPWKEYKPHLPELESGYTGIPLKNWYEGKVHLFMNTADKYDKKCATSKSFFSSLIGRIRTSWEINRWQFCSLWSRHERFLKFCFNETDADIVVTVGHSLWFKTFFRRYLPSTTNADILAYGKRKLDNCAVVKFDVTRLENGRYEIDSDSIEQISGELKASPKKMSLA